VLGEDRAHALTPTQERVVDELMAWGQPRPEFARGLSRQLREHLEEELAPMASRIGRERDPTAVLFVGKRALSEVHHCQRHHMASHEAGFTWTAATAKGVVAHKALELAVHLPGETAPGRLVDDAVARLQEDDRGPAAFLAAASLVELAELRASASDVVAKFQDGFPPLRTAWRPRLESALVAEFGAARIVVRGKVDLAIGRAEGSTARVLIIDLKTGRPAPGHADDLRLYALLETLRVGVPPFRLASYYLDSGTWHDEDVTTDVLDAAARRLIDGIRQLVELRFEGRVPTLTPGPVCSYCPAREVCDGARQWRSRTGQDEFAEAAEVES
jgi:hypothetical protein